MLNDNDNEDRLTSFNRQNGDAQTWTTSTFGDFLVKTWTCWQDESIEQFRWIVIMNNNRRIFDLWRRTDFKISMLIWFVTTALIKLGTVARFENVEAWKGLLIAVNLVSGICAIALCIRLRKIEGGWITNLVFIALSWALVIYKAIRTQWFQ